MILSIFCCSDVEQICLSYFIGDDGVHLTFNTHNKFLLKITKKSPYSYWVAKSLSQSAQFPNDTSVSSTAVSFHYGRIKKYIGLFCILVYALILNMT